MADVDLASYPCQEVVGEGHLCGMPCDPGFVRCREHKRQPDKAALANKLELAQERVLRRLESVLDDAVTNLIALATEARSEQVRLMAIDKVLTLTGFANLRIESNSNGTVDPQERDKILMEIVKTYVKDPNRIKELEAKAGAVIDVDERL